MLSDVSYFFKGQSQCEIVILSEYAENGSLYAFLQRPENVLNFAHILQWAEEIAMGMIQFLIFYFKK